MIVWSDSYPIKRPRLGWLSAVILGATLAMAAQSCEHGGESPAYAAQAPLRIAQDRLNCADHECAEGFFNIGKFSISVPANSIPADILREHRGAVVRITIERIEPRTLEVIR